MIPVNRPNESVNEAEIILAEAANATSSSTVELAKIQSAATPINKKDLNILDAEELQGTASIDWSGPIEPLVKHIASLCQYKFIRLGNEPAIPIIVTLNMQNASIASILQNVAYLAGKKAYIRVDQHKNIIELRYGRI
jgi:defect-in-organelle-trafficking protein DotD